MGRTRHSALGAAGVYVGMTRGRSINRVHLVAVDAGDACEQFVVAMGRDRADRGLERAITNARESVWGLTADSKPTRAPEAGLSR